MSIFSKPAPYGDASEPERPPRKRWGAKKILLLALGSYIGVVLVGRILIPDQAITTHPVGVLPAATATGQRVGTLADALNDYKVANAACERASTAIMQRTGTPEEALDTCGDSLRAVSDLPMLYGAEASALQSCIDMEGARYNGLNVTVAINEHLGERAANLAAIDRYRTQFRFAAMRCNLDLRATRRALGIPQ